VGGEKHERFPHARPPAKATTGWIAPTSAGTSAAITGGSSSGSAAGAWTPERASARPALRARFRGGAPMKSRQRQAGPGAVGALVAMRCAPCPDGSREAPATFRARGEGDPERARSRQRR
jgi:hypothetical protein